MKKQLLLEQFDRCFDTNGWFVTIANAVEGVTAEQAVWKADGVGNCIWETLSHALYYNEAYLRRFKGEPFEYDVENNDQTFSTGEYTEEAWAADRDRFNSVMNAFRELMRAAEESKFDEPVPTNTTRRWWEVIADMNAHNSYHAGQILLIRKLQGSWKPEDGVS